MAYNCKGCFRGHRCAAIPTSASVSHVKLWTQIDDRRQDPEWCEPPPDPLPLESGARRKATESGCALTSALDQLQAPRVRLRATSLLTSAARFSDRHVWALPPRTQNLGRVRAAPRARKRKSAKRGRPRHKRLATRSLPENEPARPGFSAPAPRSPQCRDGALGRITSRGCGVVGGATPAQPCLPLLVPPAASLVVWLPSSGYPHPLLFPGTPHSPFRWESVGPRAAIGLSLRVRHRLGRNCCRGAACTTLARGLELPGAQGLH